MAAWLRQYDAQKPPQMGPNDWRAKLSQGKMVRGTLGVLAQLRDSAIKRAQGDSQTRHAKKYWTISPSKVRAYVRLYYSDLSQV